MHLNSLEALAHKPSGVDPTRCAAQTSAPSEPFDGGRMIIDTHAGTYRIEQLMTFGRPIRVRMNVPPQLAAQWLAVCNTRNPRRLDDTYVYKVAIDLIEHRWVWNGTPIRFASDGTLLDGQHRLTACVEANVPLDTDIIFGMSAATLSTIDTGRTRTVSQIGTSEGIANSSAACALANLVLIHEACGIEHMRNDSHQPSKAQILQRVQADAHIAYVAGHISKLRNGFTHPRVIAFCYYLFSKQDKELADVFFAQFKDGANLASDNPVFQLRSRLFTNQSSKAKLPMLEIIALVFKAWIACRKNQAVRELRYRSSGNAPERFPQI